MLLLLDCCCLKSVARLPDGNPCRVALWLVGVVWKCVLLFYVYCALRTMRCSFDLVVEVDRGKYVSMQVKHGCLCVWVSVFESLVCGFDVCAT
jgi:hypothetical protein